MGFKGYQMKKILSLFILPILFYACNTSREVPATPQMDFSYLALGDSYTIGEEVGVEQSWPVQLVQRLNERGHKVASPKIVAKTGWNTKNLITNFESEIDVHRDFHLVSILIGVNNQYQKRYLSEFEVQLREIFRKAITHSKLGERGVFALSIPDYSVTPFGARNADTIAVQIDRFNDVVRRVAQENNVDLYDITAISREAAVDRNLIAGDSLHPSALMYRRWVDSIIESVEEKLLK